MIYFLTIFDYFIRLHIYAPKPQCYETFKIVIKLQESSTGFHEESSVFSQCSGTEPDSLVSLEETFQPSPVSVLELPFSSECLGRVKDDICGKLTI